MTPCMKSFWTLLQEVADARKRDDSKGEKEIEEEDEKTTETVPKAVKARRLTK